MISLLAPRRAAVVAFTLGSTLLPACFNVSDVPPLGTEGSTGPASTTEPATTVEPDSTTTLDPSATGIDPDTSTTSVDPDTSTTSVEPGTSSSESSSGPPPEPVCGDGVLDPGTETCDDGNTDAGDLCDANCQVETLVLGFTGGVQMVEVPAWVDSLEVEAWGAEGGDSICCEGPDDDGGFGGYVSGVLTTIGGTTLQVYVGGKGVTEGPGGYNGGGAGGQYAAGGGGATDIRIAPGMLANRLLVAAGGGGGNCGCPDHGAGGGGGGLSGQAGISNQGLTPGGGGTQAMGGSAGQDGTAGALGQGGTSATGDLYHFAGGGGGYYGGGGAYASGAGGGSSYLGVLENGATMPAIREGDGEVRLTPVALP